MDGRPGDGPADREGEMTLDTAVATGPVAARAIPTALAPERPRFVLVGGVPGAGKTTVLQALAAAHPGAASVDPESLRTHLARVLPSWLPYRSYRALVHLTITALVVALLLRGPTSFRRTLLVHDPATRRRRRTWTGRLARWRGWDPVLVVVDVSRGTALAGQHARRRVLAPRAFDRHWRRWEEQRPHLVAAAEHGRGDGPWAAVQVVDRRTAAGVLTALVV